MEKRTFRRWLEKCPIHPYRHFMPDTVTTYVTNVARVEKHYGKVEVLYVKDRFASFLRDPSKIPAPVSALGDYKTVIRHYCEFLDYRMRQLLRRGWIAAPALDGAPNMDILVTDEHSKKLCAIQVKTRRDIGSDKGWHMRPKHEAMIADYLFYVFVDVGKRPSARTISYVLLSKVVADCRRRCHEVWLATPGRKGQPHKDSDVRRLVPDYSHVKPIDAKGKAVIDQYRSGWLDQYRENWRVLGLPEAVGF